MARLSEIGKHATSIRTIRQNNQDFTVVQYHTTDVVKFSSTIIQLNSGGFHTTTTKVRMNQTSNQFGLGYNVFQKDFEWFVKFNGKTYHFYDDMVLERG